MSSKTGCSSRLRRLETGGTWHGIGRSSSRLGRPNSPPMRMKVLRRKMMVPPRTKALQRKTFFPRKTTALLRKVFLPKKTQTLPKKATSMTKSETRTRKRPKKIGLGHRNLPAIRQRRGEDSVSCPILSRAKSRSSTIEKGNAQE